MLVAAHTSAGKTAVAEYAIAKCLANKQRVIYTSPIKALSNQKFREFSEEYTDVGLMTGDVTINKNASCLIMTTEIYRSMLYRGSEVVREVAWVIFDEVHAMRSKDRGTVWEECFILSPENVHFVFLSATIPNAREFSEWIAKLKAKPCHTIYTDTRPVPLQHYVFPKGGGGMQLVVDAKGVFRPESFELAMNAVAGGDERGGGGSASGGGRGGRNRDRRRSGAGGAPGDKSDCYKVIKMIMERNFYPAIVFSFQRKECESLAMQMAKLDFNTEDEKELVRKVFSSAIESLMECDRDLPQISAALPLLERGIGIHHSGLLPVVKEVVEILFQENLIKALFATETFSMGLNMPAKTVVFKDLRKFDGETTRYVSSGEYVQMSGRAGRRGKDTNGISILMCEEKMEPKVANDMLCGTAEPLNSSFRLGYNMLLNLLRAEEANPEYVIARSFAQFQGDAALPKNQAKVVEVEAKRDAVIVGGGDTGVSEKEVKDYFRMRQVADKLRAECRDLIHQPKYVIPFMQGGRLVRVNELGKQHKKPQDYGWGVVIKYTKRAGGTKMSGEDRYSVDILVRCVAGTAEGRRPVPYRRSSAEKLDEAAEKAAKGDGDNSIAAAGNGQPGPSSRGRLAGRLGKKPKAPEERRDDWLILSFSLRDLDGVSALRVYKPENLRSHENRASVGSSVIEALSRHPEGLPLLDPLSDMELQDEAFVVLVKKVEAIDDALKASPVSSAPAQKRLLAAWKEKSTLNDEVKVAKFKVKEGQGLIYKEDLKRRKRVLRRLGFVSEEGVVEVKGRLACEVSTADELVITELMLGGQLSTMTPEVLVAVCSCFVVDESKKEDDALELEKELETGYDALKAVIVRVGTVMNESKIVTDIDEYVDSFSPVGMRLIYHWCKGKDFKEVCELSNMFEGSIVRSMRRLEELLRQLVAASKSIGDTDLEQKIEAGSEKLKRGIAFQASLYI